MKCGIAFIFAYSFLVPQIDLIFLHLANATANDSPGF